MGRKYSDKMIVRCKVFLVDYLEENGPTRPGTFEKDIIGDVDIGSLLMLRTPQWNRSPFCPALASLMEDSTVAATQDEQGWLYSLKEKS
jgi:hypothetical protein